MINSVSLGICLKDTKTSPSNWISSTRPNLVVCISQTSAIEDHCCNVAKSFKRPPMGLTPFHPAMLINQGEFRPLMLQCFCEPA